MAVFGSCTTSASGQWWRFVGIERVRESRVGGLVSGGRIGWEKGVRERREGVKGRGECRDMG